MDFLYSVHTKELKGPDFGHQAADPAASAPELYYRAEVHLLEGGQHYDVFGFSQEQLIHDVLGQYDKHMHFLNIARS